MFNLVINVSLSQLNYYYFHLGFSSKLSNNLLKKYFLGSYYNNTIINLNYSIFFLKISLNIILGTLLKNGRLLLFSENYDFINLKDKYLFKFFKIYFCLKRWYPGLLTRLRYFLKFKNLKKKIYLFSIPDLILVLSYSNYYTIGNLSKEAKKLLIPSINLIDTIHSPLLIDYFILLNLKNLFSILFYIKFIQQIVLKSAFLKKKFFFKKLILLMLKFFSISNEIII